MKLEAFPPSKHAVVDSPQYNSHTYRTYLHPIQANMSTLRTLINTLRAPRATRTPAHHHHHFPSPAPTTTLLQRSSPLHTTPPSRLPYKHDQDRESLNPQSSQTTMSGTDQEAADSDAAFDPSTTRPERERDQAEEGSGGNPLETSGADQSKSKPLGESGGQETHGVTKQENKKSSGGHSPQKKG